MTFGARLREERERLGMSQPAFAAIAGTTKQTLFSWESGKTAPDGFQLAALADGGTDVLYVVTGQTDPAAPRLSADEQELLDLFRAAPLLIKAAAIRALQHEGGQGSGMGGMQFTQHGSGMQVGHVSAPVTVGAPAPRRRKAG